MPNGTQTQMPPRFMVASLIVGALSLGAGLLAYWVNETGHANRSAGLAWGAAILAGGVGALAVYTVEILSGTK